LNPYQDQKAGKEKGKATQCRRRRLWNFDWRAERRPAASFVNLLRQGYGGREITSEVRRDYGGQGVVALPTSV